jgi:hypothetical protein
MVLFSICLLVLFGLSLLSFAGPRRKPTSDQSKYALPPKDWPDVPVSSVSLFQREGRINAPVPKKPKPRVRRFQNFDDTQAFVIGLVDTLHGKTPKIGLQLSKENGPEWTDVTFDGCIVAHVQTSALTQGTPPAATRMH